MVALGLLCLCAARPLLAQVPSAAPALPVTPLPAVGDLDAYQAARVPVVTVSLPQPAASPNKLDRRLARLAATAAGAGDLLPTPPTIQAHGRIFDEVNLGDLLGGQAPATAVILQFLATRAGATVWVQPLDGGAILTQDAEGKTVTNAGGAPLVVGALGQLNFSFQAPARPGRYQVLIRLDSVSTLLPFVILDPSGDN